MRRFPSRLSMALCAHLFACVPQVPRRTEGDDVEARTPAAAVTQPAIAEPSRGSVYALDLDLVDSSGRTVSFDAQRGHPVLLSMFYTSCPMACPLLIQEIKSIETRVPGEQLAGVRVVLVSMDPLNDVPAALRAVVEEHGLDARWTLGTVPATEVPLVAAALGVRYRPLPDGGYAHTSVITLVDGEGRILASAEGHEGREALVTALKALASAG